MRKLNPTSGANDTRRPAQGALGLLIGLTLLLTPLGAWAANVLEDISFSALAGNKVQIVLTTASPPGEPLSFTTDNPARIAVDLADTQSGLENKNIAVGVGMVRSISAVEAGGRTRVVVNLVDSTPHDLRTDGNKITVTVGGERVAAADISPPERTASPQPRAAAPAAAPGKGGSLRSVDFRRGNKGEGRLLLKLPSSRTAVDMKQQGGAIVVDVKNTSLPDHLQKVFDVTDFATPVQNVTVRREGRDTRITIAAAGDFDHLAYQTDDVYTVEFRPLTKGEQERLKQQRRIYTGDRLSLNFQDIEVRSVLQLLADFTGKNMVVSDTVGGRITLRLRNVPWDQALDIILKTKGLSMRENDTVILVAPTEEIAAREKLELESTKQIEELAPLRSELVRLSYSKADEIAKILKAQDNRLLSERGNVTVDERTNTLLLQDTSAKLQELRELITQLDIPMRQVMIESRVVIANNDFARDIGVRFGYSRYDQWGPRDVITGGTMPDGYVPPSAGDSDTPLYPGFYPNGGDATGLLVNLPKVLGGNRGGGLGLIVGKIGSYLLQLELTAMQQEGKGEVVSSPRVITADQTKAIIKQGKEIPYQQATSSGATSVSFKEAVLQLEVTPHITPDDRIRMDLLIKKDEADWTRSVLGTPPLDKREVTTSVLVDNGETVVLGGVVDQNKSNKQEKIPFFGDIPFMGNLFRQTAIEDRNTELLIFVTPRILKSSLALQ
jgi:type IV pilus assembly protein PilQ